MKRNFDCFQSEGCFPVPTKRLEKSPRRDNSSTPGRHRVDSLPSTNRLFQRVSPETVPESHTHKSIDIASVSPKLRRDFPTGKWRIDEGTEVEKYLDSFLDHVRFVCDSGEEKKAKGIAIRFLSYLVGLSREKDGVSGSMASYGRKEELLDLLTGFGWLLPKEEPTAFIERYFRLFEKGHDVHYVRVDETGNISLKDAKIVAVDHDIRALGSVKIQRVDDGIEIDTLVDRILPRVDLDSFIQNGSLSNTTTSSVGKECGINGSHSDTPVDRIFPRVELDHFIQNGSLSDTTASSVGQECGFNGSDFPTGKWRIDEGTEVEKYLDSFLDHVRFVCDSGEEKKAKGIAIRFLSYLVGLSREKDGVSGSMASYGRKEELLDLLTGFGWLLPKEEPTAFIERYFRLFEKGHDVHYVRVDETGNTSLKDAKIVAVDHDIRALGSVKIQRVDDGIEIDTLVDRILPRVDLDTFIQNGSLSNTTTSSVGKECGINGSHSDTPVDRIFPRVELDHFIQNGSLSDTTASSVGQECGFNGSDFPTGKWRIDEGTEVEKYLDSFLDHVRFVCDSGEEKKAKGIAIRFLSYLVGLSREKDGVSGSMASYGRKEELLDLLTGFGWLLPKEEPTAFIERYFRLFEKGHDVHYVRVDETGNTSLKDAKIVAVDHDIRALGSVKIQRVDDGIEIDTLVDRILPRVDLDTFIQKASSLDKNQSAP